MVSPMLAGEYWGFDPVGWLVSEKLDGVRAVWDGWKLVSRGGDTINAPAWFTALLPGGICLDGELYAGIGTLDFVQGTIRRKVPTDADWSRIRFHVFDAPLQEGSFMDRVRHFWALALDARVAYPVRHTALESKDHLDAIYAEVLARGGEGVVLKRASSEYVQGRSKQMLKLKPSVS
jgi:DNA ligase-1